MKTSFIASVLYLATAAALPTYNIGDHSDNVGVGRGHDVKGYNNGHSGSNKSDYPHTGTGGGNGGSYDVGDYGNHSGGGGGDNHDDYHEVCGKHNGVDDSYGSENHAKEGDYEGGGNSGGGDNGYGSSGHGGKSGDSYDSGEHGGDVYENGGGHGGDKDVYEGHNGGSNAGEGYKSEDHGENGGGVSYDTGSGPGGHNEDYDDSTEKYGGSGRRENLSHRSGSNDNYKNQKYSDSNVGINKHNETGDHAGNEGYSVSGDDGGEAHKVKTSEHKCRYGDNGSSH